MLSIIIASVNEELRRLVEQSIEQTVGIAYEVLVFENSDAKKSMCQIYNEGVRAAQFELLCFMHEDVAMKTKDWGKIVVDLFESNKKLGIAGIAGSTYKPFTPGGWVCHSWLIETEYMNLIQGYKYGDNQTMHHYRNPGNQNPVKVATVDGVWMCTRKEIATRFPFDEQTFTKFHCYDIDYCIAVARYYDIMVTFDVLLHHYSEGNFDSEWLKETIKLHNKWQQELPIYTVPLTKSQIHTIEDHNFFYFLKQLIQNGFSSGVAYKLLWQQRYVQKLGLRLVVRFLKYIRKAYKTKLPA